LKTVPVGESTGQITAAPARCRRGNE